MSVNTTRNTRASCGFVTATGIDAGGCGKAAVTATFGAIALVLLTAVIHPLHTVTL